MQNYCVHFIRCIILSVRCITLLYKSFSNKSVPFNHREPDIRISKNISQAGDRKSSLTTFWDLRKKGSMLMACLCAFLCASTACAGSIRGTVRAKGTNEPIVGANISFPGTGMGAVTNVSGEFFVSMFAGTYKIRVRMLGYKHYENGNIVVPDDTSEVVLEIFLKDEPLNVADVVIHGRANRELESSSRLAEKQANNVINVVGAQAIERSTDRTIADVLGRVSGLSLIRDQNGEGRYVVMRGLEQQYNNTLLDGIKIPSPESSSRFVPLDIFPSGLFERIEVTKALTPELAGDAIGGSTNLMMREAPRNLFWH